MTCPRLSVGAILTVAALTSVSSQEPPQAQPSAGAPIIERFLQGDAPRLRSYRAHRRLDARNPRFKAHGWMEVTTELSAQGLKWTVIDEGGSHYVRNKVLRKALEAEATAIRNGDPAKAALTAANYSFVAIPNQDADTVRIRIEPRRRDVLLISGSILLTRADSDLVQVEGTLSKSPSFWTRKVEIIRQYGRRNGVRVPIRLESTANVKIAGPSNFVMIYTYESVNGETVADRADQY